MPPRLHWLEELGLHSVDVYFQEFAHCIVEDGTEIVATNECAAAMSELSVLLPTMYNSSQQDASFPRYGCPLRTTARTRYPLVAQPLATAQ